MPNELYELIPIEQEVPPEGKYIVKTKSKYGFPGGFKFENPHIIESKISYNEEGEHTWGCKNQTVTHWYKKIVI